jgi:hypothetical protein
MYIDLPLEYAFGYIDTSGTNVIPTQQRVVYLEIFIYI